MQGSEKNQPSIIMIWDYRNIAVNNPHVVGAM
jgi:hypothetical protein